MSDELSSARRVLARLSPAAFVAALTEDERSQLRVALLDETMRVVTLQPRGEARIRNGTDAPIIVAYSRTDDSRVVYQDPEPARDFVSRGDGPLHWVPAWGTLRGEVHALDADSTACGLSLRPGRILRAAASDAEFGAGAVYNPDGSRAGRCRRCWASFNAAGGAA